MYLGDENLPEIARLTLKKVGDIDARDGQGAHDTGSSEGTGMTALHRAASNHKPALVKVLVEAGADVNALAIGTPRDGLTVLGLAEFGDHQLGPTLCSEASGV